MSQALLSIQCETPGAATAFKAEADAGELWGVSLGTTTSTEAIGLFLVIRCTESRGSSLFGASPATAITLGTSPAPADILLLPFVELKQP